MFQLTTPLTPASGRAGLPGVPGVGGGAAGGRSAIGLPDFMTFALPGVPATASGNARQDPAGDGEAVPGGAALTPPAGQPDSHPAVSGVAAVLDLSIAAARPADATMTHGAVEPVSTDAPPLGQPVIGVPARADDLPTATPKRMQPALSSDATIRSDRPSEGAVKPAAKQRHSNRSPDAAPIDPNHIPDISTLSDATPILAAPVALGPPTVEARAPAVGGSPDMTNPAAKPVPKPMDAAMQSVERRRDTPGPIAITNPGMTAPSIPIPSISAAATLSAPIAAQPALDPVSTTSHAAKPLAATDKEEARPVLAGSGGTPPRLGTVVRELAVSVPSNPTARRPLLDAERPVGETLLRATPARAGVGSVSLGTIAQILGVVVPAPARAMPVDFAPVVAAAPVEPSALAAPLPAMPASVATFLASVAPRTFATPVLDAAPAALPDALAKAALRPVTVGTTGIASSPTEPPNSAPIVIQPAGQLFAEAIHAATGQRDRPYRAPGDEIVALAGTAPAPTLAAAASVVADRAPLDMTQGHWPTKMIERIEVLRDAADAQDTRIKLIPDALGAIDVSMRRDGDTVRVHLAAERPETRALIADAQPRLAELGEQRGLKIAASSGQTSGQAGAQDFHQPRGNPAPQQSARPASARASDQPVTDDDGDQRLA